PAGLAGGGAPLGVAEFTDPEDTAVGGDGCEMVGDLGGAVVDAAGAGPAAASDEDAADDAAADDADDELAVGPVWARVGDVRFLTTGGVGHVLCRVWCARRSGGGGLGVVQGLAHVRFSTTGERRSRWANVRFSTSRDG